MNALEQSQLRAYQSTSDNLSAAEGIVRNAESLQEITSHALDKFDVYMRQINKVRERDENFERRSSDLLNDMRKESKDMASLISGLTEKMKALPDVKSSSESSEKTLGEIRAILADLGSNVKTVFKGLRYRLCTKVFMLLSFLSIRRRPSR